MRASRCNHRLKRGCKERKKGLGNSLVTLREEKKQRAEHRLFTHLFTDLDGFSGDIGGRDKLFIGEVCDRYRVSIVRSAW